MSSRPSRYRLLRLLVHLRRFARPLARRCAPPFTFLSGFSWCVWSLATTTLGAVLSGFAFVLLTVWAGLCWLVSGE
jgi:apolipoprotein N-acyltransferase